MNYSKRDDYLERDGFNGRVGKKDFSIDGKSWDYRDPRNQAFIDKENESRTRGLVDRNPHSANTYNRLYDYDFGAVRDAAGQLGIGNVNSKKEVEKILAYLSTPRAAQAEFDALSEKISKGEFSGSDADAGSGTDPIEYELSPEYNSAINRNREFEEARMAGDIFQGLPGGEEEVVNEAISDALTGSSRTGIGGRDNDFLYEYARNMRFG